MQEYFTTGELSKLFQVNAQTLHYYDTINLLSPSMRDANTGARLYKFDQVYKLTTIRYQQKLGKTLKQIREYMEGTDITNTLEDLRQQLEIVHERMAELRLVEKTIKEKASFIEQKFAEMDSADPTKVEIRTYPERLYIAADGDEFQFGNDYFYVYPTVVFHENDRKYFGVFVSEAFAQEHPLAELSYIPAGNYICGYHVGSYETIFSTFDRLLSIATARNLQLSKRTVSFNIIDQFVEPDCTKYLTQVQIQIIIPQHTQKIV